jgi:hypothetical protein
VGPAPAAEQALANEPFPQIAPLLEPPMAGAAARMWTGRTIGRSRDGRPIRLDAWGNPGGRRRVLVIGCLSPGHCRARRVVGAIEQSGCPPVKADFWMLATPNPDRRVLGDGDPELRLAQKLVLHLRPQAVVWVDTAPRPWRPATLKTKTVAVRLPDGPVSRGLARRHARAVLALRP